MPPRLRPRLVASGLRRDLGLLSAASVVVGSMIGVGIFLGPRVIAQHLPTPGLVMLVWVLGGLFVFCGALTYAEMGAAYPQSGGSYNFIRRAYGPLPAYLAGWSGVAVGKACSVAALSVGFAETLTVFVPLTALGQVGAALALIALLSVVNIVGVRHAGRLGVVATSVKVGTLVLLVAVGLFVLAPRVPDLAAQPLLPAGGGGLGGILTAFGLALIPVFFAYDGWENSTQVAEEVKDPKRNVPRSVVLGVLAVVLVYALVNLLYLLSLGSDTLREPGAAGRTATALLGTWGGTLVTVAILVSILGTVNAVILSGPRIAYAMSRDGQFFRNVDKVNRFGTPHRSILLQSAISVSLVLLPPMGDQPLFDTLLTYVIVDSFFFYALAAGAVFILRRKDPHVERPFKVPLYPFVPAVFVAGSVLFLVNAFVGAPVDSVAGVLIVLAGLPGYFYWRHVNGARLARSVTFTMKGPSTGAASPAEEAEPPNLR
jgi:amino acid transporter